MSILKQHMPKPYKSVAKSVGYALLLGDAQALHGLSVVLTARLTMQERVAIAWAVLRALPPQHVTDVASAVLPDSAGMPIAPFIDPVDEAGFWSDQANVEELEAYCVATFLALPPHRRAAFRDFVGRAAA